MKDAGLLRSISASGVSGGASLPDKGIDFARGAVPGSPARREPWKTDSEQQVGILSLTSVRCEANVSPCGMWTQGTNLGWRERRDPLAGHWKDDEREGRPSERWKVSLLPDYRRKSSAVGYPWCWIHVF